VHEGGRQTDREEGKERGMNERRQGGKEGGGMKERRQGGRKGERECVVFVHHKHLKSFTNLL